MASGSTRAQAKNLRPGNSHIAVSQARGTPTTSTTLPTSSISSTVLPSTRGST